MNAGLATDPQVLKRIAAGTTGRRTVGRVELRVTRRSEHAVVGYAYG